MTTKTKINKVTTPEFRASFPCLFKAVSFQGGQEKFSVVMVFPKKTDLSAMKSAARVVADARWPDPATRPKNLKSPFRDGAEKELEGFGPDTVFITATTTRQPGIVDRQLQQIVEPSRLYAGCHARATVSAFAYDKAGNRGVSFGLHNVQFLRDGDPLSGVSRAEEDFDALENPEGDVFGDNAGAPADDFLG